MNKMKKRFIGAIGAVSAVLASAVNSFAVLNADQLAVTGAIDTLIADLSTWAWSAILLIVTFTIGAKLFKKFSNKAT